MLFQSFQPGLKPVENSLNQTNRKQVLSNRIRKPNQPETVVRNRTQFLKEKFLGLALFRLQADATSYISLTHKPHSHAAIDHLHWVQKACSGDTAPSARFCRATLGQRSLEVRFVSSFQQIFPRFNFIKCFSWSVVWNQWLRSETTRNRRCLKYSSERKWVVW